jgi:hypothetical protein
MTRKRWIQDPVSHELIPVEDYQAPTSSGPFVRGDYAAYKSMVTGEMVDGRRAHREHLLRHNVTEVGNEFDKRPQKAITTPGGLKQTLIDAFNSLT